MSEGTFVKLVPNEELEKLRAQHAKMLAMLKRLQSIEDSGYCPICGYGLTNPLHVDTCELAALIKECGGE